MDPATRHHLAQALSTVENRRDDWRQVLARSYDALDDLFIVGVTGPPGSGKSTFIDMLGAHWAADGRTIGILAIDPSSPFSGGAILGDRLRMRRCEDLDNVFIRSMSARGHGGGLNAGALDLCILMAAHGCSLVILETVGAGQSEVDVGFIADCTIVVAVPGLGDSVQAAKAGLMEIGDIYVVNKSDLPQAKSVQQDLAGMLAVSFRGRPGRNDPAGTDARPRAVGAMPEVLSERYGNPEGSQSYWHPPVHAASAEQPDKIVPIAAAIESFHGWLTASDHLLRRRSSSFASHARNIVRERLLADLRASLEQRLGRSFEDWSGEELANGMKDPYRLADRMMEIADIDMRKRNRGGRS